MKKELQKIRPFYWLLMTCLIIVSNCFGQNIDSKFGVNTIPVNDKGFGKSIKPINDHGFTDGLNNSTIVVEYSGYKSYYNPSTLIPDSVLWIITKEHLQGIKIPRKNQFHSEAGMQNLKRDYVNSGYDQGHNSPYDDNYWSTDAEYQCFSYANMFPQRHILNAQTWERLEDHSRQMALKYGSCSVKTSWAVVDKRIGIDNVVVPLYCLKTIKYNGVTETYKMPNRDTCIKHSFTYYRVN